MFKSKIKYVLFLAITVSRFNACSSMGIEALLGNIENSPLEDEIESPESINKVLTQAFICKYLSPNLKTSGKQHFMLYMSYIAPLIAMYVANYKYHGGAFDQLINKLPENKYGLYPAIPTTLISSLLLLLSKTEPSKGPQLKNSEKALFVILIYLISYVMLTFNAKSSEKSENIGIIGKYIKPGIVPIMLSVIPALFAHNFISKYNLKSALIKFLENYNSDKDKNGQAYEEQAAKIAQGEEISKSQKIMVKNYKFITPDFLREAFDKLYDEYKNNGTQISNDSLKNLLATIKEYNVSIE